MKTIGGLVVFIVLLWLPAFGESWKFSPGGDIVRQEDGSFLSVRYVYGEGIYIHKLDPFGAQVSEDHLAAVTVGDIYAVSKAPGGGLVAGGGHGMMLKLDSNGQFMWQRFFASQQIIDITDTADGGFAFSAICGQLACLGKVDSSGLIQWARSYTGIWAVGDVEQTIDGGYLLAADGPPASRFQPQWDNSDILLYKLSADGALQWQFRYPISNETEWLHSMLLLNDGGALLLGSHNMDRMLVLRVSGDGTVLWSKFYDYTDALSPGCAVESPSGEVLILGNHVDAGYILYSAFGVMISSDGSPIWTRDYGEGYVSSCGSLPSGSYYFGADSETSVNAYAFLVHPNGTLDGGCYSDISFSVSDANLVAVPTSSTSTVTNVSETSASMTNEPIMFTFGGPTCLCGNILFGSPRHLPNASLGISYSYDFIASGTDGSLSYQVAYGELPPGLSMNRAGHVFGIPSTRGTYNFTVKATDLHGCYNDRLFTIKVLPPCLYCLDFDNGSIPSHWIKEVGTWNVMSKSLHGIASKKGRVNSGSDFPGCSQCTFEASLEAVEGQISFLPWYTDSKNYVELTMKEQSDKWIVKQYVNGKVISKKKALSQIDPGVPYTVSLLFDGNNLTFSVDGNLLLQFAPSVPVQGKVAFGVKASEGIFDDLVVY